VAVEAVTHLAWHLLHCYQEEVLYQQLIKNPTRQNMIRMINKSIQQEGKQNTSLTQTHLAEISPILLHGSDEEVANFHFELLISIMLFGITNIKIRLEKL
jgi:hypothetical protein